jgi:hypothetical protein
MKLFQQLLVAPAALGLIAPIAATAAELNINEVSGYSDTIEEVESFSQFSDVYPTDWAYQALNNLAERHGCVASPNGSMTRYEAAALLNKCLGNVAQVNEEERRLLNEFGPELAVIKGRIDGLEARVGEFEAGQFSTTTKLTGKVSMIMGAVDRDTSTAKATTFTYMQQLNLNTSFSGDDLLYTRIKTGNMADGSQWASKTYGTYLADANTNSSALKVDKLWYQFPVGDNLKVWVGPRIENYYMLASAPSIYKPIQKQFALGGNGGTYGASTDGGFGIAWTQSVSSASQPRFAVSTNYVSKGATDASNDGGGILTDVDSNWLTKVEYGSSRWQLSFAVAKKDCYQDIDDAVHTCFDGGSYFSTDKGDTRTGSSLNYGLRAYWKPEETGMIPSIQAGYDWATVDDNGAVGTTKETAAWMLGFMWKDAFIDGNLAGIAVGSRQHATKVVASNSEVDDDADDNLVWEAYYDFKLSDNITITPAIFGGENTYNGATNDSDDIFGGLIKTTFKF